MMYEPAKQQISFVLPDSCSKAELILVQENTLSEYVTIPIAAGEKPYRSVSVERFSRGTWLAQLNWTLGGHHYCDERMIIVK